MLSSELVRSVLDSAPDAMIIIDPSGTILFANNQVTALFGYARDEVVGGVIERLLPERFRGRHVGHRQGYTSNVRVRPMGAGLELFAMRKDGTEFPVEISLSPITQGDETLVAAAIRDVTQRKRVERALEEARRDAEHANLAKSRFLATASHDLRQPLQTLGLLNGALRRMITDTDSLEVLEQQEQAVDAMSRLLNALLDISKLESGAIKLEPVDFDLGPLFETMRREFAGLAASKGLRFAIDATSARAHSDPALIGQVLRNLVSNAIKYTQRGEVGLHCEPTPAGIRIQVRDSGVGIAREHLELIFDEFYQIGVGPNASRDGYGLGLSIVQRIAKLIGIRVEVASDIGVGSHFSFTLPYAAQPGVALPGTGATTRPTRVAAATRGKILLVEDEAGVRNAMRTLLRIEGFEVTATATAEEALQLVRANHPFDLLITDFHLEGERTGTEVITEARRVRGLAMPAILVTGDTSSAVRTIELDPKLRLASKPVNTEELLRFVEALLAR
jgi:PAS domain S-box-containing protein